MKDQAAMVARSLHASAGHDVGGPLKRRAEGAGHLRSAPTPSTPPDDATATTDTDTIERWSTPVPGDRRCACRAALEPIGHTTDDEGTW